MLTNDWLNHHWTPRIGVWIRSSPGQPMIRMPHDRLVLLSIANQATFGRPNVACFFV